MVVEKLIDHLGPAKDEENNLNGCSIIQDMFETKEFYNILCKKENIQRIADYACAPINRSTKASKTSSLYVINQIISHHIEKQKKKDMTKDDSKDQNADDEDDMIVQQNSDDEKDEELEASNPTSLVSQANNLVEVLLEKIPDLQEILRSDHPGEMVSYSVSEVNFVPLGQQRLRTVDLVLNMVKLKNNEIFESLGKSEIFRNIMDNVKQYPWNNFLQLKVINLCTEVIENNENAEFRKAFLNTSGIAKALVEMSEKAFIQMESERTIRNGYMALVTSISNKLQKRYDGQEKHEDMTVSDYLEEVGEDWRAFVDGELKASNENNNKTLGGCTTRNNMPEDEEENSNYDV